MTATTNAPPGSSVRIASISLGCRRDRELGDLSGLAASIAAEGLAHPVVLTADGRLVSGRRRLAACAMLGWSQIPAVKVTAVPEALEHLEAELADPRHTRPLTVAEAMSLDFALRELQWWPLKPPGPRGKGPQAPPGTQRRERIARVLAMNTQTYTRARTLWTASRGYREFKQKRHPVTAADQQHARELIAGITDRSEVFRAYGTYKRGAPGPLAPAANGRRLPVRDQARAIDAALAALHGVITGLRGTGEISPAVPADVAARWESETTAAIKTLNAFRKTLREQQAHASRHES